MTAFNIDRFTTSGAPGPAFGTGGMITATFPQTALGARATTVLVEAAGNILVGGGASSAAGSYEPARSCFGIVQSPDQPRNTHRPPSGSCPQSISFCAALGPWSGRILGEQNGGS
jgi:hypothetical protein